MSVKEYNWLTIHFARFADELAATDATFAGPPTADVWRLGPDAQIGENGFRVGSASIWGGIGYYENQQDAQDAMALEQTALPFAGQATESWHALAGVVTHRGEIDLSTLSEPHPEFAPLGTNPGGVLAIITSAGYTSYSDADHARHKEFLVGVEQVRDYYASLPANVMRQVFNPPETPDGCTFSIWRGTPEMLQSAYKHGTHSDMLEQHRISPLFDRSSFTRLSLQESRGTWGGVDPLQVAQATH